MVVWQSSRPASFSPAGLTLWPSWLAVRALARDSEWALSPGSNTSGVVGAGTLQLHRWSLEWKSHHTLYNWCNYISILGCKLMCVCKWVVSLPQPMLSHCPFDSTKMIFNGNFYQNETYSCIKNVFENVVSKITIIFVGLASFTSTPCEISHTCFS